MSNLSLSQYVLSREYGDDSRAAASIHLIDSILTLLADVDLTRVPHPLPGGKARSPVPEAAWNSEVNSDDLDPARELHIRKSSNYAEMVEEMKANLPKEPLPPKVTPDLTDEEFKAALRSRKPVAAPVSRYKQANPHEVCPECQGEYCSHPIDNNHKVEGVGPLRRVCCEDLLILC